MTQIRPIWGRDRKREGYYREYKWGWGRGSRPTNLVFNT